MKLHYIPDEDPAASERWLPGYPASDHDEDDPARIAVMLASGLYAEVKMPHSATAAIVEKPGRTAGAAEQAPSAE